MDFSALCAHVRAEHKELTHPRTKWGLPQESLTKEINFRTCLSGGSIREKIFWAHDTEVFGRVVIDELLGKVCDAWSKIHQELLLTDAVLYPMITRIYGFGPLGIDGIIVVTFSRCSVDLQGGWGLGMTQCFQGCHNWTFLLCVMIGGSNFRLCNWSHNNIQNFALSVYGDFKRGDPNSRHDWIGRIIA